MDLEQMDLEQMDLEQMDLEQMFRNNADSISNWYEHYPKIMHFSADFIKEFASEINIELFAEYILRQLTNNKRYASKNDNPMEYKSIFKKIFAAGLNLEKYYDQFHKDQMLRFSRDSSIIYCLAWLDDVELLEQFVDSGLDINDSNYPALLYCTDLRSLESMRFLIKRGANINQRVQEFSSGYDFYNYSTGVNPLFCAVRCSDKEFNERFGVKNSIEAMRILINAKADVNIKDDKGQGVYHYLLMGPESEKRITAFQKMTDKKKKIKLFPSKS